MELHAVNNILEHHPSKKASKGSESENLRQDWLNAKETYRKNEARAYLEVKAKYQKDSIATLNAKVSDDFDLYKERLAIIAKETLYRKANIVVECLDDQFTGAKKLSENLKREMTL